MEGDEQDRGDGGRPPPRREQKDRVLDAWLIVQGLLMVLSIVGESGQHETLAAWTKVCVVLGDTAVAALTGRGRR